MRGKYICTLFLCTQIGLSGAAQPPQNSEARIDSVTAGTQTPGKLAVGTEVTISGSGFGAERDRNMGKGSVWLGGKEAPIKSWRDTQITALLPIGAKSNDAVVLRESTLVAKGTLSGAGQKGFGPPVPAVPPVRRDNGILVNDIKIYDDQALQQSLNAARAQLAAIQVINQSGLTAQIGTLQGATLSQSAFGLNIGTPPVPGITTTANTGSTNTTASQGANNLQNSGNSVNTTTAGSNNQVTTGNTANNTTVSTVGGTNPNVQTTVGGPTTSQNQSTTTANNNLVVTGPSTQATTTSNNQTQVTGPSTVTVTTQAPLNPTAPTLPASTLSLPSSFSPGASNILNEQLELTYEISGYQLLLEGALNDHYMRYLENGEQPSQRVRPRATIGVPITINPSKRYVDAVAEIILEVHAPEPAAMVVPEPIMVTAILPRDKTYNVATITDKSVSIGGAVATQVLSLGVSALWGHKAYFVVQDQDTVALQLPRRADDDPYTTRFGWQIRPVLGQKVVTTGMRNGFVQLAFPELPDVPSYGWVHITTQWMKYDRKRGVVLDVIPDSIAESDRQFDIPRFKLNPVIGMATYEDNADGSVTVSAKGDFLAGTFAKAGPLTFVPGVNGTIQDPSGIRFTLPAIQLATHNAYLVDRGGDATNIVDVLVQGLHERCLVIKKNTNDQPDVKAIPAGAGLTQIEASIGLTDSAACIQKDSQPFTTTRDLVAVVGNQVFGLRNSPFLHTTSDKVTFLVPTGLLQSSRHVVVKRLLWGHAFEDRADFDEKSFQPTPVVNQATVVSQTKDQLVVALVGTGLKGLQPLLPDSKSAKLDPQEDTGAILTVQKAAIKGFTQVVLTDSSHELFLVNLPAAPSSPQAPQIAPVSKGQARITIPAGGQDLDSLVSITYEGNKLTSDLAADRKSVSIAASNVTSSAGTKELVFTFKDGNKVHYSITVVDLKVETLPPATATTSANAPPK